MSTSEYLRTTPRQQKRKHVPAATLEALRMRDEAHSLEVTKIKRESQLEEKIELFRREFLEKENAIEAERQQKLIEADELEAKGEEEKKAQEQAGYESDSSIEMGDATFVKGSHISAAAPIIEPAFLSRVDNRRGGFRIAAKDSPITSIEKSRAADAPAPAVAEATPLKTPPPSSQPRGPRAPIIPGVHFEEWTEFERLKRLGKNWGVSTSKGGHPTTVKRRKLRGPESSHCTHPSRSPQSSQSPLSSQSTQSTQSTQSLQSSQSLQSPQFLQSLQSSQSSQPSLSHGEEVEVAQAEASKNTMTSVPSAKPAQPMFAPSRNTKRLSLTPKNTPAASDEAHQPASQPARETCPQIAPMIAPIRPEETPQAAPETASTPIKRRRGRPKGVKNKPKPAQQAVVSDGAGSISQCQNQAQEILEREADVQNRSSSYLEVEAPTQGSAQPAPTPAVEGNRRSRPAHLQKASKQASATEDRQRPLFERMAPEAGYMANTVVPESGPVEGQAESGWITVNGPKIAPFIASTKSSEDPAILEVTHAATSQMQQESKNGKGKQVEKQPPITMQVVIRAGSEVCFDESGNTISRVQREARKLVILRAQQEAEEQRRSEEKATKEAARRAQDEVNRNRNGRFASVVGPETRDARPESRAVQALRRREVSSTNFGSGPSIRRPAGPAVRHLPDTRRQRSDSEITVHTFYGLERPARKPKPVPNVSPTPAAEERERSVAPLEMDMVFENEESSNDSDYEELLDEMDAEGEPPAAPETPTPSQQSVATSSDEAENQDLPAQIGQPRTAAITDLPTPPVTDPIEAPVDPKMMATLAIAVHMCKMTPAQVFESLCCMNAIAARGTS